MFTTRHPVLALVVVALMIGGCASAKVSPTKTASRELPRPDVIIVHDFAVTPAEVELDKGLMAKIYRDNPGAPATSEELRVGHIVAQKLSEKLVAELTKAGIPAVREGPEVRPTSTSVVLVGQFEKVSQGSRAERVWVGFGLGGSELRTRGEFFQNGELISQGVSSTQANLKPGMLASGAAAVATGGVAPLAAGAVTTGYSEAFAAGVEGDASRMAAEVARKVKNYYRERGWLK